MATSLTSQLRASRHLPGAGHTQQVCTLFAGSKALVTALACGAVSVPVCRGGTEAGGTRLLEIVGKLRRIPIPYPALTRKLDLSQASEGSLKKKKRVGGPQHHINQAL